MSSCREHVGTTRDLEQDKTREHRGTLCKDKCSISINIMPTRFFPFFRRVVLASQHVLSVQHVDGSGNRCVSRLMQDDPNHSKTPALKSAQEVFDLKN